MQHYIRFLLYPLSSVFVLSQPTYIYPSTKTQCTNVISLSAFGIVCSIFPFIMYHMGGMSIKDAFELGATKYDFQSKC